MKDLRRGQTLIRATETRRGWYLMVGSMAVCTYNAPPHLHRRADPEHPNHGPKVPVDSGLTLRDALRRAGDLCARLDREPTFEELREVLA